MSESLFEYAALHDRTQRESALRIDRAAHRLRGVKILGFTSTNGRTYEREAVRRALKLYEGARVNVNHPASAALAPRDYHDRLGSLVEVRLDEEQGLFGDLFYNPKHPLAEQLLWDAEHAPHHVGLSHNVLARTTRRNDATVVTEIVAVVSVDLVADPATTRGLFEEQTSLSNENARVAGDEQRKDPEKLTPNLDQIENRFPSPQPSPETCLAKPGVSFRERGPEDDPEQTELAALRQQVAAARLAEARAERSFVAARLLREAGLPEPNAADRDARALVDATFWESLLACERPEGLRERIAARVELIRAARAWSGRREADTGKASGTQPSAGTTAPRSREQAAESLRRGPEPTREEARNSFVAALKRK
jgi:hypothetical protein